MSATVTAQLINGASDRLMKSDESATIFNSNWSSENKVKWEQIKYRPKQIKLCTTEH